MARQLFIVARTQIGLYHELRQQFASDPNVTVIFDRRYGIVKSMPERDRRRNQQVDADLRERSLALITLPDPPAHID
jgi:hypothetical protein